MIVEGKQIPPNAEIEMEAWMRANEFTASEAMRQAEGVLKRNHTDFALAHRMVDRMIQTLRRKSQIAYTRVAGRGVVWSARS